MVNHWIDNPHQLRNCMEKSNYNISANQKSLSKTTPIIFLILNWTKNYDRSVDKFIITCFIYIYITYLSYQIYFL